MDEPQFTQPTSAPLTSEGNRRRRIDAASHEPTRPSPVIAKSGRSDVSSLLGVQILGVGSYAPPEIVTNADLVPLGYDPEWIIQRTGILERRRAANGVATSDLALEAANRCIADAGVERAEIDLIVVATMTPDTPSPSTACHLQRQLGSRAPAMDVNAACAGFMYALVSAMQFVAGGGAKLALVVGADTMSRTVHPSQTKTFPLFGDGAGAVLVGRGSGQQGLASFTLGAEGEGADLLYIPGGGSRQPLDAESLAEGNQYLAMDGRSVFKWAVRLLSDTINDVLDHAGLLPNEIDHYVLHQANSRIIDAAVDSLGIDRERVVVNLERYGNTSAGSIPLALQEAHASGRIAAGNRVLMCGFGAGLAWGTAIMQW